MLNWSKINQLEKKKTKHLNIGGKNTHIHYLGRSINTCAKKKYILSTASICQQENEYFSNTSSIHSISFQKSLKINKDFTC